MSAADIIARCTIDGVTRWSHVAQQMGRCVDSVRAEFDPRYLRAYIWAPSREPRPEMDLPAEDDEDSFRSTRAKSDGLRVSIIARLGRGSASAETLAAFIGCTVQGARNQLSKLKADGQVVHTRRLPYTWSLSPGETSVAGDAA